METTQMMMQDMLEPHVCHDVAKKNGLHVCHDDAGKNGPYVFPNGCNDNGPSRRNVVFVASLSAQNQDRNSGDPRGLGWGLMVQARVVGLETISVKQK
ncbi:hypothetical protein ACFX2I_020240 [Malus domestica]